MRRLMIALLVVGLALGSGGTLAAEEESPTETLGPEHPDTFTSMNNLASILLRQGDFAGARDLEEQVVEARTRTLGPEHPSTLTAQRNLAVVLAALDEASPAPMPEE